jgi:hypothetical protein
MGRPKNFTRDAVLEKALPVFWRRGFADASLHELEQLKKMYNSPGAAYFPQKAVSYGAYTKVSGREL